MKLLWIALAGAAGTVCRYGLNVAVRSAVASRFAWGTLLVNALGCFLFGAVVAAVRERGAFSGDIATVITVGFLGAFTTFSTMAFETGDYARAGAWWLAAGNVAANVILGLLGYLAGAGAVRAALQ